MRLRRRVTLSLLAFLALASGAAAQCASTDDCLRLLEDAQRQTRTITASFVQTKHVSLLDEPIVSSGRFVFARPDRILWAIEKPQATKVVIRGQGVHIPGLAERDRQALASAPVAQMFAQLGGLFSGSVGAMREAFDVTASGGGDAIAVKLVPRRDDARRLFRSVELSFAQPELLVRSIRLEDSFGDFLTVEFRDVRRNGDVPDSMFDTGETGASG